MIPNDIKYAIYLAVFFGIIYIAIRYNKRWREPEAIFIRYVFGVLFTLMGAGLVFIGIDAFVKDSEIPPVWAVTLIILLFVSGISTLYTTRKLSNELKNKK